MSETRPPRLTLSGLAKRFPGVRALHDVALELHAGEVTALVGENGAGKSTLVKILTGIHAADSGEVRIDGTAHAFASAHEASAAGITAIHQETVLFDELSVAENIYLGHAPRTRLFFGRGLVDWKQMHRDAAALLARVGATVDTRARLRDLGIANKHLVAIARALSIDASVVIMDEPTASLSHTEIEELYALIETLKRDGKAVLFISHKFDEVFRIADRYVVLRDGERVGAGMMADVDESELVHLMIGRTMDQVYPTRQPPHGEVVLAVDGFAHPTEFDDIGFELRAGEILGFYGLVGAGRSEFMQALFGITRPSGGRVRLDGRDIRIRSPADAVAHGLVYVPEDRGRQGAVLGLPIVSNIALPSLARVSAKGFISMARQFALAREYTARLDLRAAALDQRVGELSGGNQQKVVIGKWLATQPRVIIVDEPTKGIDIGSKAAVHAFIADLAAEGLAVIMVSSEIPEILGMCERVIVMREGRIAARLSRESRDPLERATPESLVRAAAGIEAAA